MTSSFRSTRRDSSRLSWHGPRPGPIAAIVTEHRRSLGTSWLESSRLSATARRVCRWDSGFSALRTGIATARSPSIWRSRHATWRRCRATSTSRVGASLPISGLTAWQGLFQLGRLQAGQSVLAHGAAGAVGSIVTQLAREAGPYVIGTGRAADQVCGDVHDHVAAVRRGAGAGGRAWTANRTRVPRPDAGASRVRR